jgi:hypothetical protein
MIAPARFKPDHGAAEKFLNAISRSTKATFFAGHDREKSNKPWQRHGQLHQLVPKMCELSEQGFGMFVTINETDGSGKRTVDRIIRVRACFVDLDGAPLTNSQRLRLRPHIVVTTSSGRYHLYWRVQGVGRDEFTSSQRRLARLMDGDPAVSDLSRVMRLPGFPHQKREPFMVIAEYSSGLPEFYCLTELEQALDEAETRYRAEIEDEQGRRGERAIRGREGEKPTTRGVLSSLGPMPAWLADVARPLSSQEFNKKCVAGINPPPPCTPAGVEWLRGLLKFNPVDLYEDWRNMGFALEDLAAQSPGRVWEGPAKDLFDERSRETTRGNYDPASQAKLWQSAGRPYDGDKITLASLIDRGRANGWTDDRTAMEADRQTRGPEHEEVARQADVSGDEPPTGDASGAQSDQKRYFEGGQKREIGADSRREELVVLPLDTVAIKPVDWLWQGRIAIGKLTLFAGHPGFGKSLVSLDIAARVSHGGLLPCGEGSVPKGNVLLLSAEDDPADTYVPRLTAAGADLKRIKAISMVVTYDKQQRRCFDLTKDIERLEKAVKEHKAILVIIDPVSAYMGKPGKLDTHRNADVRAVLAPLQDMATRCRVAIVLVTHLTKDDGKEALLRVTGSGAFAAAARGAYMIARDEQDGLAPGRRLFLPIKNNLGQDKLGLSYKINTKEVAGAGMTPAIEWGDVPISMTADEILAAKKEPNQPNPGIAFLFEALRNGPRKLRDVEQEARQRSISSKQVERARRVIGVQPWGKEKGTGHSIISLPSNPNIKRPLANGQIQEAEEADGSTPRLESGTSESPADVGKNDQR